MFDIKHLFDLSNVVYNGIFSSSLPVPGKFTFLSVRHLVLCFSNHESEKLSMGKIGKFCK